MGVFSDMAKSKVFETGRYFVPGNFEVEILKVLHKQSEKNKKQTHFIVECKVLSYEPRDGQLATAYRPGESVSAVWDMTSDSGPSNAKLFVMRAGEQALWLAKRSQAEVNEFLSDFAPSDKEPHPAEAHFEDAVGPNSSLVGVRMRVEAFNKPTKANKDFTRVNWIVTARPVGASGDQE